MVVAKNNEKPVYILFVEQFDCQGYIADPEVKWHVDTTRSIRSNRVELWNIDACALYRYGKGVYMHG